jgi:hypothetical protein
MAYVEALARICHANPVPEDAILARVLFENVGDRNRLCIRKFVTTAWSKPAPRMR